MIDFTAACARGARETKQLKDAGRRPWWYQGRARGRRDAQVVARHPRARGRGISHPLRGNRRARVTEPCGDLVAQQRVLWRVEARIGLERSQRDGLCPLEQLRVLREP